MAMTKKHRFDCRLETRLSGSEKAFVPETTRWKVRSGKSLLCWIEAGRKRTASIIIVVLMCLSMLLGGCQPDWGIYTGDYPEAFTLAINNLIGTNSGLWSVCGVIEKDDYGRAMYYYYYNFNNTLIAEESVTTEGSFMRCAVIISQKVENGHVYFYPDYNFISFRVTDETAISNEVFYKTILQVISDDDLDGLKNLNDWNKPFDENKCISLEIVYKSRDSAARGGLVRKARIEEFYAKIHSETVRRVYYVYLTSDDYDRHIYFVRGKNEGGDYTEPYILLFNFDGSYDLTTGYMEITDFYNYQDALKAFKEQNHWNEPYTRH